MKQKELKAYVKKNLCPNFCAYYKTSGKEDLACLGFMLLERLIQRGHNITFNPPIEQLRAATGEKLVQHMCTKCPFFRDDCDFVQQKKGALPCGGFLLLGDLLEKSIISIDDIYNII
jgi:hypothetical protein